MTKVWPTAIVAMNVLRASTLVMFSRPRKRGLTSTPNTHSSASAMNGATAPISKRALVGIAVSWVA